MSAAMVDPVESRAAVLKSARHFEVDDVHVSAPSVRQVRVRLEGCGVCASNLPVWEGRPWFRYPFAAGAPGHEGWGVIDAVGADVTDFAVGERVALISGHAYAEHDVANVDSIVRIPESLSSGPVPAEPLGCAMNIFRRSDIQPGQNVAIVGIGFLGALLTALCVRTGARVTALSRRRWSLELAEQFGASELHELSDAGSLEGRFDRVIEAVGNQQALDIATPLAGVRARLVIAGFHQDGPRSIDLQRWNWQGLDVVNAHERDPVEYRRGMQEAIELIAKGELDPTPLYTHIFPLSESQQAFTTLEQRPDGFCKALIRCA